MKQCIFYNTHYLIIIYVAVKFNSEGRHVTVRTAGCCVLAKNRLANICCKNFVAAA